MTRYELCIYFAALRLQQLSIQKLSYHFREHEGVTQCYCGAVGAPGDY